MSDTVEQARRLVRQAFRREWDGRWPPAQKHEEDALDAYAAAIRADERANAEVEIARLQRENTLLREAGGWHEWEAQP
jgi:hypothetical protein